MFVAGQQIRAAQIRDQIPQVGVALGSTEITNTVNLEPVPGCMVVAHPRTHYALDGVVFYAAGSTPGITWALNAPLTALGGFTLLGPDNTVTDSVGSIDAARTDSLGADDLLVGAGSSVSSGYQAAMIRGRVLTGTQGGTVQLMFTQTTANAAIVAVHAGSWIRLTKVRDA